MNLKEVHFNILLFGIVLIMMENYKNTIVFVSGCPNNTTDVTFTQNLMGKLRIETAAHLRRQKLLTIDDLFVFFTSFV
jgi:hypothetical protein